jgi:hypothetical protein
LRTLNPLEIQNTIMSMHTGKGARYSVRSVHLRMRAQRLPESVKRDGYTS